MTEAPSETVEAISATTEEPNAIAVELHTTTEVPNANDEVANKTFQKPYNTTFSKDEHIILELSTGDIFEGNYAGGNRDRIDLIDTKQYNNENVLGGVYSFYRNEIEGVYLLKTKLITDPSPNKVEIRTTIGREEYYRLEKMAKDYVYISRADDRYFKAISTMKHAENIGIAPIELEPGACQLKLLAVSTWKEVYLFDFMEQQEMYFYPELKQILGLKCITKVIHDSCPFLDLLESEYNITIKKIFDTELVDLIIQQKVTGVCAKNARDLSECINYYLGLPAYLVKNALKSSKNWDIRPLNDDYKLYAAQLVTYLIVLKKHMEKVLLSETYNTMYKVHEFYSNKKDPETCTDYFSTDMVPEEVCAMIPLLENLSPILQLKEDISLDEDKGETSTQKNNLLDDHSDDIFHNAESLGFKHYDPNKINPSDDETTGGDSDNDTSSECEIYKPNKVNSPNDETSDDDSDNDTASSEYEINKPNKVNPSDDETSNDDCDNSASWENELYKPNKINQTDCETSDDDFDNAASLEYKLSKLKAK